MKISTFTKPELDTFRKECNFTDLEMECFNLKAKGKTNISQENLDNQTQELDAKLHKVVDEIHRHLTVQDEKINKILEVLDYDKNKETG